jgi:hypothetical protein
MCCRRKDAADRACSGVSWPWMWLSRSGGWCHKIYPATAVQQRPLHSLLPPQPAHEQEVERVNVFPEPRSAPAGSSTLSSPSCRAPWDRGSHVMMEESGTYQAGTTHRRREGGRCRPSLSAEKWSGAAAVSARESRVAGVWGKQRKRR